MDAPVKPSQRLEAARRTTAMRRRPTTASGAFYRRGRIVFQFGSNTVVASCEDDTWAARIVSSLNLQIANGAIAAGVVPEKVKG